MKIGIVGDIHWSKYSSIVRSRGEKYSTRLENCIKSINWAEDMLNPCDLVVYLGDFFDKSDLCAEELSALSELHFNDNHHIFLVGNHEMGINNLMFSSAHVFNFGGFDIIDKPTTIQYDDAELFFLPYILEDTRESLGNYVPDNHFPIIFSHNDIKGIQMGPIISRTGFDIEDIENHCKMFFNGHLHNGVNITDRIINVGNLTGQNFSEDATKYKHRIFILDTDECTYEPIENPHAFNFLKLDVTDIDDYTDVVNCIKNTSNPVVTIKIRNNQKAEFDWLDMPNRKIIQPEISHSTTNEQALESLSVNHLDKFKEYILEQLGNGDSVVEEIESVTR